MILFAYIYSLRKYIPYFQAQGKLKSWLKIHIFFGVVGPYFAMVHSTFHIASYNGGLVLITMLLVVTSGVVGRYLYVRAHIGLNESKKELLSLQQIASQHSDQLRAKLALTPEISHVLKGYEAYLDSASESIPKALKLLLLLRLKRRSTRNKTHRLAKAFLYRELRERRIPTKKDAWAIFNYTKKQINHYLALTSKVASLSVYTRLFSFWRMIHVPLLLFLISSGIVHVIAVHMY